MDRKINKVGKNTLTVSLPSKWIKKFNIDKSSSIQLTEEGDKLILSAEKENFEVLRLNLQENPCNEREVLQAYKKGYDEIKINFNSPKTIKNMMRVLQILVGFEVIEQSENSILLKNIAQKLDENVQKILDRTISLTLKFTDDLFEGLKEKDLLKIERIIDEEAINNRLCLLAERMLIKDGYREDYESTPFVFVFFYKLENIADNYKCVCSFIKKHKKLLGNENLISMLKKIIELKEEFFKLYFEKKSLGLIGSQKKEIKKSIQNMSEKTENLESIVLTHFIHIIDDLYDLSNIQMAINLSKEKCKENKRF